VVDDDRTLLDTSTTTSRGRKVELEPDGTDHRYDVGDVIGKGGMGEVRIATDKRIERLVAVKLMHGDLRDDVTVARFFREAKVQGGLEHPAVPPVYDLGVDREGNPYFVMKRLAGITLQQVLSSRQGWTRQQLLARFVDVCFAVGFAHSRGVVHRDLKPSNIMLGDFGDTYVLDWGLARRGKDLDDDSVRTPRRARSESETATGDLLGTPGYMAPEQARGGNITERADVFSLGCVLYEILADAPALPRGVAGLVETLEVSGLRPAARDPDVPPELDDLCARVTAQDPAGRPTARELAEKLQAYLDGDRDVTRRRQLANEHVDRARKAIEAGDDDESRALGMREVGRALVFDPANAAAQQLLQRLLIAPDRIPAAALAAADAERAAGRRIVIRDSAGGFLGGAVMLAVLFLMPLRAVWPVILLMATTLGCGGLLAWLATKELPLRTPWELVGLAANCVVLLGIALLFGPFYVAPIFVVGSLGAFLSQPTTRPSWVIVVSHAAVLVIPIALELVGVLPSTFTTTSGHFVLEPWVLGMTPTATAILNVFVLVAQFGITYTVMMTNRRTHEAAQNRVHSQHWHLHQLLPHDIGISQT